jgi:hypothetical protein
MQARKDSPLVGCGFRLLQSDWSSNPGKLGDPVTPFNQGLPHRASPERAIH